MSSAEFFPWNFVIKLNMNWGTAFPKNCMSPREESDHPAHLHRLISLCCPLEDALGPWLPIESPAKIDQNVRMCMLI